MFANYSFDVKNIGIWAPAFFKHNNSVIATVEGRGEASFDIPFMIHFMVHKWDVKTKGQVISKVNFKVFI